MKSKDYWRKREAENLKSNLKTEAEYVKTLNGYYDYMLDQIQKEINAFYAKYADKEKITLAEAKKRVSRLDIEAYERKAKRYVAEKNFSRQANEEMRLYNATMKINRLEMLKANIGLELVSVYDEMQQFFEEILQGRTETELKRQAGILGETVQDNAKTVQSIVNASFYNATFSDRIWLYQDVMKAELSKLLQTGLIQGRNPRVLARDLTRLFEVRKSDAERLMRTELARVQIDAQKQAFARNGYDQYVFIAHGDACDKCKPLDNGKPIDVDKMMPGENAPPMHPNCRCSTAAYMDQDEFDEWLDSVGRGENSEKRSRLKIVKPIAKLAKNGTIKSGAISGARNPFGEAASRHAARYYGLVRSMTTDVSKIAKHTKYPEEHIQAIKNYLFIDKHDLGDSGKKRFDPDYMIAESWQRLIENRAEPHDLVLIKHEIMEKELMEQGMSQDKAHRITSQTYDYGEEAKKFYAKIKKYKKE